MPAGSMTQTNSTRRSRLRLPGLKGLAVLSAISLAIWWNPLVSCFALALRDEQYTHILLILPVSLALIFLDWKLSPFPAESSSVIGIPMLVAALLAKTITPFHALPLRADERLSLDMLALVGFWIGSFIISYGFRTFRRVLFPLLFLFWLVPIPEVVLTPVVKLLQDGSAESARMLFTLIGVPVSREGTLLTIPGLVVEVARECSSIRSSLMLVVTTMVLTQTMLRSAWKKAVVIAIAIPLSIAKNGLRIFVLGMLTTRVDRSFITGRLHHQGGIIYFLVALTAIILLTGALRRSERTPTVAENAQSMYI